MSSDFLSRIAFIVVGILAMLVRIYFSRRKRKIIDKVSKDAASIFGEGKINFAIRRFILLPILIVAVVIYFINPDWNRVLTIPFPKVVIWMGFALGMCGIFLLAWVHSILGKEWSVNLKLNREHKLIQSGPYANIRHPMYTALFMIYFGLGIISCNYIILSDILLASLSLSCRIPYEEKMMTDRFGDQYRKYIRTTGRFLPKFNK